VTSGCHNTSIQNNVTISTIYIHSFNNPLKKTLYHAINVTSMEAILFAIRCSINQVVQIVICKSTRLETTFPWWSHLQNIQACLPWQPPFSQHILWQCCNHLGILSSMAEILLFNLVFHDGVTPVSVSTLKPPLGVIGVFSLKP